MTTPQTMPTILYRNILVRECSTAKWCLAVVLTPPLLLPQPSGLLEFMGRQVRRYISFFFGLFFFVCLCFFFVLNIGMKRKATVSRPFRKLIHRPEDPYPPEPTGFQFSLASASNRCAGST